MYRARAAIMRRAGAAAAGGAQGVMSEAAMSEATAPPPEPFFAGRRALQRQFNRAAQTFANGDALHREVAARMRERLGYIKLAPARALDLGCATGATAGLHALYPKAHITGVDFAFEMTRRAAQPVPWLARLRGARRSAVSAVCADMAALPLAHASMGLVWSNLALHWLDDPEPALREVQRVLELGGLFMFSTLGPDTLCELREAWSTADGAGDTAAPAPAPARWRVKRFIDLHDIGDLLVKTGFATPVMDMEKIVLTYDSVDRLAADLRATGSGNAMHARLRGLTGRRAKQRMVDAYETRRNAGRLPATFEVVYGHAWKAPLRKTAGGDAVMQFVPRRT